MSEDVAPYGPADNTPPTDQERDMAELRDRLDRLEESVSSLDSRIDLIELEAD